jgi:hypothetical protein
MQELADEVWRTAEFHEAAAEAERTWLKSELESKKFKGDYPNAGKLIQAAAILACSDVIEHRRAAFRVATCVYELSGAKSLPLDQGLRVVLARLGNFPSFGTRPEIEGALSRLPAALAIEEVAAGQSRAVEINGEIIFLTDFQLDLWRSLQREDRVAVAAPTSAGKSFILEGYLASLFASPVPRSMVYLVPTRALIAQVSEDLAGSFDSLERGAPTIVTVPIEPDEPLPDRAVYVMTQERVQILMSGHPDFSADLIVVDEAHSVAESSRGVLLQWVIDDLLVRSPQVQILFATPNVRNLDVFGRLFGLDNVKPFSSVEPTVAQNFLVAAIESAAKGTLRVSTMRDGSHEAEHIAVFEVGQTLANRAEKLVHIAAKLGVGESNIVYANGAAEAELIASQLAEHFADRKPTPGQLALSQLASEAVHPNYALVECAKVGIGFHYSNIPTHLRRAVEAAVSAGDIDYLVCTSTLLQGVNLPAKNIFMFAPTKGKGKPLQSTDFWNLSGRAGRLRREFQGNIFLIDYENWEKKPLEGPREAEIIPAIENNIKSDADALVSVIRDNAGSSGDRTNLESTFVRLLSDRQEGRLEQTLGRIGVDAQSPTGRKLSEALEVAHEMVDLPPNVLRNASNVSAHKQQRLFNELSAIVAKGRDEANTLLPKHPREVGAYDSYAAILERCHRTILEIDTDKNLHRFHALLAVWWMEGWPLPEIVERQIKKNPKTSLGTNIRNTLDLIETQIRFQAVRFFGCYISILKYALSNSNWPELATTIPSVPVFLEIGASDKTMVSFISLGLSRVAAMRLNNLSLRKDLDEDAALSWLRTRPLDALGLSPLLMREIELILDR